MDGYPKLMEAMDSHPDIRIFRNFSALNIQNLLYLQAELLHLEKEWREIVSDDADSGDPIRKALQINVSKLLEGTGTESEAPQWAKFREIRAKLAQYNSSLLEFSRLSSLKPPETDRLQVLQSWLERPGYGNAFLQGVEARAWSEETGPPNFVAIGGKPAEDTLTKWLHSVIPGIFHNVLGYRLKSAVETNGPDSSIYNYDDATLIKAIHILSVVLSSLLPTISIFALFYTHNTTLRLVLVLIFTSLFTLALSVFTKSSRIDIFAATAAFTAVEVVFVGSAIGSQP